MENEPERPQEPVHYATYLRLDTLLDLQSPRADVEHDEVLFIVIHQVYELWFKEILHELDHAKRLLRAGDGPRARHTLHRILTILKVLVAQLDVLETMTPLEFLSFRARLTSASGFQSDQFRQMEFELGQKRRAVVDHFPPGSRARAALEERWSSPGLWDAFLAYLAAEGYDVPGAALERDPTAPVGSDPGVQDVLISVYRDDAENAALCERLVDLDEGVQEWRYRHVKMVERTIGSKRGTGGSAGSKYLSTTLMQPVFPDLWEIRTRL